MRWLVTFALVVLASSAHANEPDRAAIELAFLEGRLEHLDAMNEADWGGFARFVRDAYWRVGPWETTFEPAAAPIEWIRSWQEGEAGPYPRMDDDPLPVLTALIVERQQREREGRVDPAPLRDLELSGLADRARRVGLWLLEVHEKFDPGEEDVATARRADELAARNAWLGLGAVLLLLIGCVLFAARVAAQRGDEKGHAAGPA